MIVDDHANRISCASTCTTFGIAHFTLNRLEAQNLSPKTPEKLCLGDLCIWLDILLLKTAVKVG